MMAHSSSIISPLAPKDWVLNIQKMLKDEDFADTPICIHKVPQILRAAKPEAYTPQYIGLGPYHHWREDLFETEQKKLIASKKSQKDCQNDHEAVQRLDCLANRLMKDNIAEIRASYDTNLNADDHTLAWMMVVDSLFLIQFLQVFTDNPAESCLLLSSRTKYLTDRNQSAYYSIIRDIMMLENQIPMFVFRNILACDTTINDEVSLPKILVASCEVLSPLKTDKRNLSRDITQYAHLLELLYYLIVPEKLNDHSSNNKEHHHEEDQLENNNDEDNFEPKCLPKANLTNTLKNVGQVNIQFVQVFANSKPVKVIGKMVGVFTAVIPENLSLSSSGNASDPQNTSSDKNAPKVEEIAIPSVSELQSIGIKFCRKDGPITCIEFDKKTRKFYLPVITIDTNTEVIIRNLVAYEAEAISSSSVLARYTELINGIIDTPEDVRILRERKILHHHLKKDEDVAQLWNRMSRSIRLSYVPPIDKAIKEINEYYKNRTRVKFYKITKGFMLCGWRILMLFLALVVMVLLAIQSFCEVYKCPRLLGLATKQP